MNIPINEWLCIHKFEVFHPLSKINKPLTAMKEEPFGYYFWILSMMKLVLQFVLKNFYGKAFMLCGGLRDISF